jgi:hypothetical protein
VSFIAVMTHAASAGSMAESHSIVQGDRGSRIIVGRMWAGRPGECNRADVQLARRQKAVERDRARVALLTGEWPRGYQAKPTCALPAI